MRLSSRALKSADERGHEGDKATFLAKPDGRAKPALATDAECASEGAGRRCVFVERGARRPAFRLALARYSYPDLAVVADPN